MVKAAEHGQTDHLATACGGRGTSGYELSDPLVGSRLVEIPETILAQHTLQVTLAENSENAGITMLARFRRRRLAVT
jgi:hypothetical protein